MKTILLILFLSFRLFGQNLILFDDEAYNPLTDETGWALYLIGEKELATDVWGDQSSNNRDLTLTNAPTLSTEGSRNTLTFNGSNEYGKTANFTLNQPFAIIMVCKEVTLTGGDRFTDGSSNDKVLIWRPNATTIALFAGATELYSVQLSAIGWSILVAYYDNANSTFTINGASPTDGTIGTNALNGFTLAANSSGANAANIEVGFVGVIALPTSDVLTRIEDYLKTYYGISY